MGLKLSLLIREITTTLKLDLVIKVEKDFGSALCKDGKTEENGQKQEW